MFSIAALVVLILTITAGVLFGTDLSRRVNLFPGFLIVVLACAVFLLWFNLWTPIVIGCFFFLTGLLAVIVIYLTEKQRPLIETHQQIDNEIKWWLKQLIKTVFQK